MRVAGLILLLSLALVQLYGQKQDNIWFLGDSILLDFTSGVPVALGPNARLDAIEASSSICDSAGNLLFYTNNHDILSSSGQILSGGMGQELDPYWIHANKSLTQGTLILPSNNVDSLFYIISIRFERNSRQPYLFYSIINFNADNRQGEVISLDAPLFSSVPLSEKLIAVQHSNGVDWWVLFHSLYGRKYYKL